MAHQDPHVGRADTTRRRFLTGVSAVAAIGVLSESSGASADAREAKITVPDFVEISVDVGEVILGARVIGSGSGETIVILPSLARGALDFDPLARRLAVAGYRVISIDPRGIGGSWAPSSALAAHHASDLCR